MKLIEITLCHPSSDTRIYQKYIKSLLKHDIEVGYVAPFPKVNEEENETAKEYLDKAKSKGLSKKYLTRYEMDEPTFKDFASALNTVGDIP